ncbi:hypothetical protein [Paenibacillus campi]|uniref:hypothetical protein n=1 Tax=Paenibacillus campi TaxID=3106031 RepID=UPI002AFEFB29|nr:hypothetical protein [Paenibacillus sp. SGZ-1014]
MNDISLTIMVNKPIPNKRQYGAIYTTKSLLLLHSEQVIRQLADKKGCYNFRYLIYHDLYVDPAQLGKLHLG